MFSGFLNNYDIVIFDCDGVIVNSNLLKCEAFGKAIVGYPKTIVDRFVNHCKETFGISRYVKFREFFKIANEPFDETKYTLFLKNYEDLCEILYNKADLTPSIEKLLTILNSSNHKLYVASGSDQKELIEVFDKRNLNRYFKAIYGSPNKKTDCVASIIKENPNKRVVFIGDALSDLKASKDHNIDFIYMSKYTVQSGEQDIICNKDAIIVINTLEDLI